MTVPDARRAVDTVWRLQSARIISGLARIVRDIDLAEDLAQDALVAALRQWPESGIPPNPGAWIMATAKHRAIDRFRRDERLQRNIGQLSHELRGSQQTAVFADTPEFDVAADDDFVPDDLLRLMFVACHPVLSTESRVALTLRLLGGLTTDEIARAFLAAEPTIAQRIVRAKRTLASRQVAFEVPPAGERAERMGSVLEVIYLILNEGYTATAGENWARPELCYEALRIGRMLAELSPADPEVHGLVALMEIQSSRLRARVGGPGADRPAEIAAGIAELPPSAQRARRSSRQARPPRRGARGIRARGCPDPQRAGAIGAPATCRRMLARHVTTRANLPRSRRSMTSRVTGVTCASISLGWVVPRDRAAPGRVMLARGRGDQADRSRTRPGSCRGVTKTALPIRCAPPSGAPTCRPTAKSGRSP